MGKHQSGRPVVLYTQETSAFVFLLDGEGPKFFRGRSIHIDADTGKETIGGEWKYEKARYRIIAEGKRFDLVKRIREAHWRYEEERLAHDEARSRAEYKALTAFREKWSAENPYPKWPGVEAILEGAGIHAGA